MLLLVGFTLDKSDKTKRIPIEYGSHEERAWSESTDLVEAKLWVEADKKLTEYHDICGGFIGSSSDATLAAKVAVGLAKNDAQTESFARCFASNKFCHWQRWWIPYRQASLQLCLTSDIAMAHVQKHIPAQVKDNDDEDSKSLYSCQ